MGINLKLLFILILITVLCGVNLFATQPFWSTLPSTRSIERHDSLTTFNVTKYDLTLAVNEQTHYLNGNVKAYVTAEPNLTEVTYELTGGTLAVTQVLVNDNVSAFTHTNGVIHIPVSFSTGTQFTTQVFYSGTSGLSPAPYNIGLKYNTTSGNTTSFYTLSNPDAGRYWWPSYDHPWDKAFIDLHITVRSDWLVAANGTRQSIVDNGNGTKTHNWTLSSEVATYVVGIAAANFVEFTQQSGAIPIQNFVLPGALSNAQTDFANLPEMINFFSTIYGPYPFEKYGHAAVPISPYAAMEHQTLTTIGSTYITGNQSSETIIAHELAHQWMGNYVTPLTMQDVWLKESFATYSEFLWKCHHNGWTTGLQYLSSEIQNYYLTWENSNGPHTIYNPVYNELFAPPTYEKSASVLHMLRLKMGNAAFYGFIQSYINAHANGNVITAEIKEAAEQSSGLNLDQFFNQWIYHAGIPSASLTYFSDGISHAKIIAQTTSNTTTAFDIEIPLHLANSALMDSVVVRATPQGFANVITINPATDNLVNVQIDPNHWVLNRGYTTNTMNFVQCLPSDHTVNLTWETFTGPFVVIGYNIWRKAMSEDSYQTINDLPLSQLTYQDTTVQNGITYQYYITTVIADGYQSVPSNILDATPIGFPFTGGLLLVDETRDGTGSTLSPTDAMVDSFYESALTGMQHVSWDVASQGAPTLSVLSYYPLVLWHSDDFSDILVDDYADTLSSYIGSGGKLVISGWKYPGVLPQTFMNQWFPSITPTLINSPILISAQSTNYPMLHPEASKLPTAWNNMLSMAYIFPSDDEVQTLYTAELANGVAGNGEPLAIRADFTGAGSLVLLGFPLYYMQETEVQAFLYQLLPQLYPPVSNSDVNSTPQKISINCYPNPFGRYLNISMDNKSSNPVDIAIYNIRGQKIRQWLQVNSKEITWDGMDNSMKGVSDGIYFVRVTDKSKTVNKKVIYIKMK